MSGQGLKRIMSLATTHRLAGILTGVFSTVIVQSSSIITVMAVGFVTSGLMDLAQAINVIIGSNIGTTATAWLIAYVPDVGLLGHVAVAAGALLYFFVPRESVHNLGLALVGLGLVFMGLYWMNHGIAPIKGNPSVRAVFAALDAGTPLGLVKCFAVSLAFTAVVQSSAATTAIAMALAVQGVITFETAAATVFGMNVGTTATAWLATVGGTPAAKRTALAHTLFNVVGTMLLMPFFIPFMLPATKAVFPDWASAPAMPMAMIHTTFNVVTTLLFLPFVKPFARFVTWAIPAKNGSGGGQRPRLSFIDRHVKQSPQIACDQAFKEMCFMSASNMELMEKVRAVLVGRATKTDEEHVFHREETLDRVQMEITDFLGRVMTSRLPVAVADLARMLLRVTDELESASDEAPTIVKAARRLRESGGRLEADALAAVLDIHDRLASLESTVDAAMRTCYAGGSRACVQDAIDRSADIRGRVRAARESAIMCVGSGTGASSPCVLARLDMLNAYDRVRSYYLNIAESLAGGKRRLGVR